MAKTIAAFYGIPSGLEKMNRIQQQIDLITRPLRDLQSDYTALTKAMTAVVDSPAIQDITKISALCDSQSISAIYHAQDVMAKINTSGMVAVLQQYQAAIGTIVPQNFQVQLGDRFQEWSRVMSSAIPYQIEPLTEARAAELTRLSALAEECIVEDFAEKPCVLSEEEQQLVVEEIEEILHSGKNWDQRFAERTKNLAQTYPSIAWVLVNVLLPILIGIIANMVCSAIGRVLSPTNVYEEPHSSSPVVYHIEVNQNMIVVGDAPYYYEVKIQDESTGCCYTGYVSKRSVSLMESKVESFTELDEK